LALIDVNDATIGGPSFRLLYVPLQRPHSTCRRPSRQCRKLKPRRPIRRWLAFRSAFPYHGPLVRGASPKSLVRGAIGTFVAADSFR
jgi:hypothetical protein